MIKVYNIILQIVEKFLQLIFLFLKKKSKSKVSLFVKGQHGLLAHVVEDMKAKPKRPTIWFHASSLGEFAVARPLIARLKQDHDCTIVVTFFSSTGCEALKDNHPNIDYLYYLPLDTKKNVCAFLDAVKPDAVAFIISEFWCNYLYELKRRAIPTYLISGLIRDNASFFKWYGGFYRKALNAFTQFFVLDKHSKQNLNALGFENVTISGDPLFDNAYTVATTEWHNAVMEHFVNGEKTFIAGSIHDENDLNMVSQLANKHRDTKFIFVPHEISSELNDKIKNGLNGGALCYTECGEKTDFSTIQVLIIDFVGALAYLYRYGTWAYVGGGFTRLLHSVIEATVYGLPVSFGPRIHRKVTPNQLVELNIGRVVHNFEEIDNWFVALKGNDAELKKIKETSAGYLSQNVGATERIVKTLGRGIWE